MARRGSFGLQPRVAPNIGATVVALAREYVAQRNQTIMDAWKNGGTFEGKKVTDEMVLKYWQDAGKDLDKQDPEYDQARNQVMQLEYGIAQSKAAVLHAQNKMSDGAFAQFYLKWANKVPKNSEFYRTLQMDAAQLIEASKAHGRALADKAKTDAFNKFVTTTTDSNIAIGDAMTKALTDLSKQTGLSITGNGDELLSLLTQDVKNHPDQYRQLTDTIHKADPGFDGNLTEGYFSQHIKAAVQGYDLIADRAHKDGFVSAYASATQGLATMSQWGSNIKVWPVSQPYTDVMNSVNKVWNNPNSSQMDKMAAANQAAAVLDGLAKTPGIDAGTQTMITADAARLRGQDGGDSPSFGTSMLGRAGVTPEMAMQLGSYNQTKLAMDAAPGTYSYGPVDKNGNYDPTGQGPLGMVPVGTIPAGAQAVMVPGADGKAVMAFITPHTVYTTDPNNPNASPKGAGYQLSYNVGGNRVELWSYNDNAGKPHWVTKSPLAEGATATTDNKGDVYVTPAKSVLPLDAQIASLKGPDGSPLQLTDDQRKALASGGSFTVDQDTSAKGKAGVKTVTTISVSNGYIQQSKKIDQIDATGGVTSSTTTPQQITATAPNQNAFSSSLLAAGDVQGVTLTSPMAASVDAAKYTQTSDQVSKWASDPSFQQQFLHQTMAVLGTQNPYDPRIAAAWQKVTTNSPQADMAAERASFGNGPIPAAARADLRYPGPAVQAKEALGGSLNINFGNGQTLNIPGLPSYLQNAGTFAAPNSADNANRLYGGALGQSGLLAGLNIPTAPPPVQPAGQIPGAKPTTATPGATPNAAPTAAPTATPAPTAADPFPGKTADDNWSFNHGK